METLRKLQAKGNFVSQVRPNFAVQFGITLFHNFVAVLGVPAKNYTLLRLVLYR